MSWIYQWEWTRSCHSHADNKRLSFPASNAAIGCSNLSGACAFESNLSHVQNIGRMIEPVERFMFLQMDEAYFLEKSNEIIGKVIKARRVANEADAFAEIAKMCSISTNNTSTP